MANCKNCGKPIKWAKTQEGKFIPMEKGIEIKEYLMVVDYEENDRGWKTPIVKPVRLYEAHRQYCGARELAPWEKENAFQESSAGNQNSQPNSPPPPASNGGFSFGNIERQPGMDDDLPF